MFGLRWVSSVCKGGLGRRGRGGGSTEERALDVSVREIKKHGLDVCALFCLICLIDRFGLRLSHS